MEQKSDTRTKIIQVAMDLLYRYGYEALGVKEICARAEVSKSSFYHFFSSKEELALAVVDTRWQAVQGFFAHLRGEDLPPLDKLRQSFGLMYQITRQTYAQQGLVLGCPFGSLGSELAPVSPVLRERLAEVFDWMELQYRELLEEAVASGELPPGFNAAAAGKALLAAVQGMSVLGKVYNSPETLQQSGEFLFDTILGRAA